MSAEQQEMRFVRKGRILSVTERRAMRREIERDKADIGDSKQIDPSLSDMPLRQQLYYESQHSYDPGRVDKSAARNRIRRSEKALAEGLPDSISKYEKEALLKRARQHEAFFKKQMCPQSLTNLPYGHQSFQKAVEMSLREHSQEFQRRASDWKNIQRQISPDDPSASNLERVRPK